MMESSHTPGSDESLEVSTRGRRGTQTPPASTAQGGALPPPGPKPRGNTAHTTAAAVASALQQARRAQSAWGELSFAARRPYIEKMRQYILRNADALADALAAATGKTRIEALAAEVLPCTMACAWYGKNAAKVLAPKTLPTSSVLFFNKRSQLVREPLGVVAIISPWNYPLTIPFGELVMGLMAGNAIVLKVSPETPSIGLLIRDIVAAGELPAGLFHLLEGDGAEVASALFAHGINKIFFTGSVRVGKILAEQAAKTLTPLSLELGGKDPMIVLEDADLERASNGALWGAFQNAGQTCAGIERVYVAAKVFDAFTALVCRKTRALRHGEEGPTQVVDLGRMTTARQWAIVDEQVKAALAAGATIAAQSSAVAGGDGPGYFPATVLLGVDHSMPVMREETFGPVLCLMKFNEADEAVALANDSPYALTASVWTRNLSAAKRLAKRLRAGVVTINDHLFTHALSEIPWGGPKDSGLGRTHGALGLEEMTVAKVVNWDLLPMKRNVYWYPYSEETYPSLKAALQVSSPRHAGQLLQDAKRLVPYYLKKVLRPWKVDP